MSISTQAILCRCYIDQHLHLVEAQSSTHICSANIEIYFGWQETFHILIGKQKDPVIR